MDKIAVFVGYDPAPPGLSTRVEVFNWGDGEPRNNGSISSRYSENEDAQIPPGELYPVGEPDASGICIDVPDGVYDSLIFIPPYDPTTPGCGDDGQIDAFEIIEDISQCPVPTP